jgi:transcriptional regulator with XRE-family HTH domain
MTIGEQIRAVRIATGLSQQELARRAGVAQSAVSEIETGVRLDPKYSTVKAIFDALSLHIGLPAIVEPDLPLEAG